jgi:cystinosin
MDEIITRSTEDEFLSFFLGWAYCFAWSASFYPQIILNFRRKCIAGCSLDYLMLNLMGYSFYSIFTCTLRWNATIRGQYNDVYSSNLITMQDIVFATHGAMATAFTIYQCLIYDRKGTVLTPSIVKGVACVVSFTAIYFVCVMMGGGNYGPEVFHREGSHNVKFFSWLCFVDWLSYTKIGVTFVKNIPQVLLNIKNKSTIGWSINQVLLDLLGGVLSTSQILFDGYTLGWSGVLGDPIKLGLGLLSIIYDLIYVVQHFLLYTKRESDEEIAEEAKIWKQAHTGKYKYQSTSTGDVDIEVSKYKPQAAQILV